MPVSSSLSSCCFVLAAVICSSSARTYVLLASHSSELLSAFFCLLSFAALCRYLILRRLRVVSFAQQLVICSSPGRAYVVFAAFLILRHIIQKTCRLIVS